MTVLYVTEQGASLHKRGKALLVRGSKGDIVNKVELLHLNTVVVFGGVSFSTQTCVELLKNGVDFAFMTLGGKLHGHLVGPLSTGAEMRMKQHEMFHNSRERLMMARAFVLSKIGGCIHVLKRHLTNYPSEEIPQVIEALEKCRVKALEAIQMDTLRGWEGQAARRYFGIFPQLIRSDKFVFEGRRSNPSPDPVNALLSLGYVMLCNEITALLGAVGLDPWLGFYHEPGRSRSTLAFDLMEEFRHACVDRFTLNLINLGTISPGDFQEETPENETGCRLTQEGLKKYLAQREKWMTREFSIPWIEGPMTWRKLICRQCDNLAKSVRLNATYSPLFPRDINSDQKEEPQNQE